MMATQISELYSNTQKILIVEGDLSFSLSLAKAIGSATNITAASLDTREELVLKYNDGKVNLEELERFGCTLVHGVNVHTMALDNRLDQYDKIVFNYPHSGLGFGCEHQNFYLTNHQELVKGFMDNARKMRKDDGEIQVTYKTSSPYNKWEIETLALEKGLSLIGTAEFNQSSLSSFSNKKRKLRLP